MSEEKAKQRSLSAQPEIRPAPSLAGSAAAASPAEKKNVTWKYC
ncbi:hypothetical protein [Aminivibrio sp.]|nr:hypothetical protein [Synergistaceae bacterium]